MKLPNPPLQFSRKWRCYFGQCLVGGAGVPARALQGSWRALDGSGPGSTLGNQPMPLKQRPAAAAGNTGGEGSNGGGTGTDPEAAQPLLAPPDPAQQRTQSVALPTPFRETALAAHPEGLVPLKRAGGVFRDKYGAPTSGGGG